MWHYVILKDGTLQRGRPIELSTVDEMPFAERTIHIGFIAGYDVQFRDRSDGSAQATPNSITTQQWKTFNDICETLLNIKPGIGILGHNDIHNASTCPGFDVEAYVSEKFGYTSPYVPADFESANALTIEEMGFSKYLLIVCFKVVSTYLEKVSPTLTCFPNILKFIKDLQILYFNYRTIEDICQ